MSVECAAMTPSRHPSLDERNPLSPLYTYPIHGSSSSFYTCKNIRHDVRGSPMDLISSLTQLPNRTKTFFSFFFLLHGAATGGGLMQGGPSFLHHPSFLYFLSFTYRFRLCCYMASPGLSFSRFFFSSQISTLGPSSLAALFSPGYIKGERSSFLNIRS